MYVRPLSSLTHYVTECTDPHRQPSAVNPLNHLFSGFGWLGPCLFSDATLAIRAVRENRARFASLGRDVLSESTNYTVFLLFYVQRFSVSKEFNRLRHLLLVVRTRASQGPSQTNQTQNNIQSMHARILSIAGPKAASSMQKSKSKSGKTDHAWFCTFLAEMWF